MIVLESDNDIRIAGDKPSLELKRRGDEEKAVESCSAEQIAAAKELGKRVALRFAEDAEEAQSDNENGNYDMILQRRLLLSFTATVGFELCCKNDRLDGIAQRSFLDTLSKTNTELYASSSDTGAFSFYYLAFRRGGDVDRRIGQTFAMLCSHDGDPIFQELGEAVYCWFLSEIRKYAKELKLYNEEEV